MTFCFEHPACSMHCAKPVQSNALGIYVYVLGPLWRDAPHYIAIKATVYILLAMYCCCFPVLTVPSSAGAAESLHQAGRHLRRLAHVRGAPRPCRILP